MDWIVGMQKAIDYIENHLTEKIDYDIVAAQSFSSSYHFQRVFSILCGFTIGEYIRNRRLSLAGSELATTDAKVIDVALKYGYESPDSFAKAFKQFHGVLPSQVKNNGVKPSTKLFIDQFFQSCNFVSIAFCRLGKITTVNSTLFARHILLTFLTKSVTLLQR